MSETAKWILVVYNFDDEHEATVLVEAPKDMHYVKVGELAYIQYVKEQYSDSDAKEEWNTLVGHLGADPVKDPFKFVYRYLQEYDTGYEIVPLPDEVGIDLTEGK